MTKRGLFLLLAFTIPALFIWSAGQKETTAIKAIELEVEQDYKEYESLFYEIWSLYEEENPAIKIKINTVTEDKIAAFEARVAAGDAPAFTTSWFKFDQFNYTNYVNLLEIDYPYWDKFTYDAKALWHDFFGVNNYVASINPFSGWVGSFIYYKDEMEKTGLNPRESVRTMQDLEDFLVKFKGYVDANPEIEYVLDQGWHGMVARYFMPWYSFASGYTVKDTQDLFLGKIRWDDAKKNPFVPYLEVQKRWYKQGITPRKWTQRDWAAEFEPSFVSKKAVLVFHGPWLWDNVEANNPSAQLSGFPLPASGDVLPGMSPTQPNGGGAIYATNRDKTWFDEAVRAFVWWFSPETTKMVSEATGFLPAMDLKELGGVELRSPQYREVIKPGIEGYFGHAHWDSSIFGDFIALRYRVKGTPDVIRDNITTKYLLDYLEDKLSLQEILNVWQERWENAYKLD